MTQPNLPNQNINRWAALWTLVLGFFMIMVDGTIVSIATPRLMEHFDAGVNSITWVTNAYLLAFAVPMLLAGRLGDVFGANRLFILGMVVFTAASLACGLANSVTFLIIARIIQGIGGALLTPQSMSVITKIFYPKERPKAMAAWGATAGVAMLVGPLLGGLLVDSYGWRWILFINIPVGIITLILSFIFIPHMKNEHVSVDYLGALISGISIFLFVFAIQEGETYHWGTITGPISIWSLIIIAILLMVIFFWWQGKLGDNKALVPIHLFSDRNFVVASACMTIMGASMVGMGIPFSLFVQQVGGLNPTRSALLTVPMALLSMIMAPVVANLVSRYKTSYIVAFGLAGVAISFLIMSKMMTPTQSMPMMMIPVTLIGFFSSFVWSPLANAATRNLGHQLIGAGSGVFNTIRQIGAVVGSAITVAIIRSTLTSKFGEQAESVGAGTKELPDPIKPGFSEATANSIYFIVTIAFIGFIISFFIKNFNGNSDNITLVNKHEKVSNT